jgi:hypothetical protein
MEIRANYPHFYWYSTKFHFSQIFEWIIAPLRIFNENTTNSNVHYTWWVLAQPKLGDKFLFIPIVNPQGTCTQKHTQPSRSTDLVKWTNQSKSSNTIKPKWRPRGLFLKARLLPRRISLSTPFLALLPWSLTLWRQNWGPSQSFLGLNDT